MPSSRLAASLVAMRASLPQAPFKIRQLLITESLIKAYFSRHIEKGERISRNRKKRGERGLWQRRFWEHLIRDETDYRQHVDYIHWNPVKHGYVKCVKEWPYSSFHRYVAHGIYPENWGDATKVFPAMAGE
jgi:putative transposase